MERVMERINPDVKPRLIYDVTQLAHWSGNITGIPRVMNELAIRLRQQDQEAVFAVWVKDIQGFCEIDLDKTLAHRGHGIAYLHIGDTHPAPDAEASRPGVAMATKAPRSSLTFRRVAKAGIVRTARINGNLAHNLERRARQWEMKHYKRVTLCKDDILVIPWGEWWDVNFTECLISAHGKGVKLVQIIHDLGPTIWPQFFEQVKISPTSYNKKILPLAGLVLVPSQNTKKELIGWLKQNKLYVPKIEVFREGDDLRVAEAKKTTDPEFTKSGLNGGDFIMCVGTVEAKKNHALFYYTYKLAKLRGIELPKLVIVGRRGYHTENIIDIMNLDPDVRDKFIFLFNTSDQELSWLYDHCMFTVLPSFHEGWGIPIAESVARGVPCICSNTSSMVEIAEDCVEHFSPASSDECLAAIKRWLEPAKLEVARERTRKYVPFSWDKSFEQVKKYLKELS
jgi:glycosyltransferase involved in cell wall biosynthesis